MGFQNDLEFTVDNIFEIDPTNQKNGRRLGYSDIEFCCKR